MSDDLGFSDEQLELLDYLLAEEEVAESQVASIPRRDDRETYPLSFAQERMWFLAELEPESPAYNIPAAVRLRGSLDAAALAGSLAEVVRRHESLRSSFAAEEGRAVQRISAPAPVAFPCFDLSRLPASLREAETHRVLGLEARRSFDLRRGSLMRCLLVRLADDEHVLLINFHHIVADGWSMGILIREVTFSYRALSAGTAEALPDLPIQYADFAAWQRSWLRDEVLESQLSYWKEQLEGAALTLELPVDRPRPPVMSGRGATRFFTLRKDLAEGVMALSRRSGTSSFMTLLAAFELLLFRYTGRQDFLLGTPIANRNRPEIEGLIGFFVNTLVVRARLEGALGFERHLEQVRRAAMSAYDHQDLPFEKLVEELQPVRDRSRAPLFQVMFMLMNAPEPVALPGLELSALGLDTGTAKFDLLLMMNEDGEGFSGSLEVAADLFDRTTVERFLAHFECLLGAVLDDPVAPQGRLDLLPAAERLQLLSEWSGTATPYPREAAVHELFAEQAASSPEAVALVWQDGGGAVHEMSYGELERRSNLLAHLLLRQGVAAEALVGLFMERSPEMVLAILGILKAGAAYAPLDPGYPKARLAFLIEDTRVPLVLTQGHLVDRLPAGVAALCLDADWEAEVPEGAPAVNVPAARLCYVMYTSGTTGVPKGVAVPHRAVVRLVRETSFASFGPDEVFLQLAPISFDASTLEIWGPLLNGGRLVLHPPGPLSLDELAAAIERHAVTTLWLTAGLFHQMAETHPRSLGRVRRLLAGGDVLSPRHVREMLPRMEGWLVNGYGPTENTTFTCCHPMRSSLPEATVPIGRPIANTTVYLLDDEMQPVPAGVAGNLFTGGDGLARGYFARPAQTADVFVPHPLATTRGERLYRTGDQARFLPDGRVEFLGRKDHQVKLRGFRIELGEIEARLEDLPGIAQAAVVLRRGVSQEKRLVGYVVLQGEPPADLRSALEEVLPSYMVPSAFVTLTELPLDPNGKVDRKALPEPEVSEEALGLAAPQTPTEEALVDIYSELLGVGRVGAEADFFELGGHSLLATRLVSRIRQTFEIEIALSELFRESRIRGLAARVDAARGAGRELPPIGRAPRDVPPPLSFAQQRLWFLHQLEPWNPEYHMPAALEVRGRLDVAVLQSTLDEVVRRHEVLRTHFAEADAEAVQIVEPPRRQGLPVVDLTALEPSRRAVEECRLVTEDAVRLFDLSRGPLFRTTVLRRGPEDHVLLVNQHHVVSDGWSIGVLLREVGALYRAFSAREPSPLPELPVQYADFASWQRGWLRGETLERQLDVWRRRLGGVAPLELPTDRPRPAVRSGRGQTVALRLPVSLRQGLEELSRRVDATLFMTLLAAFQVLLARFTGQYDVAVGTPIAGRRLPEVEGLIGFFVNTLVLRSRFTREDSFSRFLDQVREMALEAYEHQDVPFEQLVEELYKPPLDPPKGTVSPERDRSRTPLFQVMLSLQTAEVEPLELPELTLAPLETGSASSKFDLTLGLDPELLGSIEYATDLFDATTVQRLARGFETLLASVLERPSVPLATLETVPEAERQQLLVEWNAAPVPAPLEPGADRVVRLFEAQARRTGEAVALVFERGGEVERLTYAELDGRANALAQRLRGLGVGAEVLVGVAVERSPEMLAALLAVWKAGGAYVPLDPSYPPERLAFMLEDCEAAVLLTREALKERFSGVGCAVLCLDALDAVAQAPPPAPGSPENLAYVIYTSGSTGRAKGVAISHASALALVDWAREAFSRESLEVVLASTSISFDISIFELFVPLAVGGRVVLVENALALPRLAVRDEVTLLNTVPSAMAELVHQEALPVSVEVVNLAGEPLPGRLARQIYEQLPAAEVRNLYGPSEDTTYSTWCTVPPGCAKPSIGRSLPGTAAYLVDSALRPVPLSAPGELYLGGAGLARGYLGRPALTAERFLPDPWSTVPGARLYRTGDLVRYLVDGRLDFLGRIDHQVKIRGFRIELGEVEVALEAHPAVAEAVVLAREDEPGEARLVAYVVASSVDDGDLRGHLAERLPGYMVPSFFVVLEEMPRLPNGKVNRRNLPAPEGRTDEASYIAPRTAAEEEVAAVFAELLRRPKVGAFDDFFALGGHSLLATRVVSRLRRSFGVELTLTDFFDAPRVAELAARITGASRQEAPALVRVPRGEPLPLSFNQRRLWFLHQLEPWNPEYHMPAALEAHGPLDVAVLQSTLDEIVRRHEVLRTRFVEVDGEPFQIIEPPRAQNLPVVDLAALPPSRRVAEERRLIAEDAVRLFDLARGPLLRVTVLRRVAGTPDRDEHVLLLNQHHIVSDGWSIGVLVREVGELYRAFLTGKPSPLPELSVQYADFAAWQRGWLRGETLERQLEAWRARLLGVTPLELPADRPRPAVRSGRGRSVPLAIPEPLGRALEELGRQNDVTLFMTLLAGFQALLARYTGRYDVAVGTPVAGRRLPEVEGLIGFFVDTLVLRSRFTGDDSFLRLLARVRETALEAFENQDVPFEQLVDELDPERDRSRTPIFQVMLTVQTAEVEPLDLAELRLLPLFSDSGTSKFDLTLSLAPTPEGSLVGSIQYAVELFDETSVLRLGRSFATLLESVTRRPAEPLSAVEVLAPAERAQMLREWSATEWVEEVTDTVSLGRARVGFAVLQKGIEAWAARSPQAVALLSEQGSVSYRELDERATRLGRHLRSLGVRPEVMVAVAAERVPEVAVGLLAIWKAGGVYLPLDPAYPEDRLAFLLRDAGARFVLARRTSPIGALAVANGVQVIGLDDEIADAGDDATAEARHDPDHLAYVIYTSGTTGIPKGVAVTHRQVFGVLQWWYHRPIGFDSETRALQNLSLCFDFGLFELVTTLLAGGTLYFVPEAQQGDPARYAEAIARHRLNTIQTTPSLMRELIAEDPAPTGLRMIHLGGEALGRELAREIAAVVGDGCRIYNGYGPTETSINSTVFPMPRMAGCPSGATVKSGRVFEGTAVSRFSGATVPIGRVTGWDEVYVVDRHGRAQLLAVPGELLIGGTGVARGYLGRPALTAERFVPHVFAERPGQRLYRTGDLVRWLPGGELEFLGRIDHQVKLRGLRIELGEIEAAVSAHESVSDCVVMVHEDRLVAWVVPSEEDVVVALPELVEFLRGRLPGSVVPAAFVVLEEMPLTPNGKVDRAALLRQPPGQSLAVEGGRVAPRTPAEELLAGIWAEVLGTEEAPGVKDDFFELGGHSLLATRVVSRIRRSFGVELKLSDFFEAPRIADLAFQIGAGTPASGVPLVRVPREEPLPLSFAQQRLWFLHQLEPWNPEYHMPAALEAHGRLDLAVLQRTLDEVVRRHEVLRTRFAEVAEEPVQVVEPPRPQALPVVDLAALPPSLREKEERRLVAADAVRLFDLTRGPLLRTTVLRRGRNEHVLLLNQHHIASDGWSTGVLVREVGALYRAFAAGEPSPLPELPVQYADFAVWQRSWLRGETLERQLEAWRDRLLGVAPLELPTDRPRPAIRSGRGRTVPLALGTSLGPALEGLGRRHDATLFMTLLAAFQAFLARHTGQYDVAVGTPIAGRRLPEVEGLIGFFVNTLVLRARFARGDSFSELLAQVRRTALEAYEHQDVPFEQLVDALFKSPLGPPKGTVSPERDRSRTPLFQVMLVLQTADLEPLELGELKLAPLWTDSATSKFDLTLALEPGLFGSIEYASELFDRATVLRLARSFATFLGSVVADPSAPLATLEWVPGCERQQLLVEWSALREAASLEPGASRIHHLFEAQARRTPEAVALVLDGPESKRWTYAELDGRAEALAAELRAMDVGPPEVVVGVAAERVPEVVVSLLAVWKAGGVYLPLDPALPEERLAFLLRDAGARIVLARQACSIGTLAAEQGARVVFADAALSREGAATADPWGDTDPLAYVIYTSGTTGTPKGVGVTHRQVLGGLTWFQRYFGLDGGTRVLQNLSPSFDFGLFELVTTLFAGGTLFFLPEEEQGDLACYAEAIARHGLNTIHTTPSLMRELIAQEPPPAELELVHLGGEALSRDLVREILKVAGGAGRVYNGYGPTEASINSTVLRMEGRVPVRGTTIPIGRPSAWNQAYVLDRLGRPQPCGVPGELLIGGPGLARGYLGRPALTAGRFVPHPFAGPGERLYRTGDLVRWLPGGELEFLGRIDHQVKLRGFRIELGEIEAAVLSHEAVSECVVTVHRSRLVAWMVATSFETDEVASFLRARLPEYMVPSSFVTLEDMPRTPNGKADRAALLRRTPPGPEGREEEGYVAPATTTERALARIFAGLLDLEKVGRGDDFFALGGHSLLATRVVSRIRRDLGVAVPVATLFNAPTLAAFAERVDALCREAGLAPPREPVTRAAEPATSFAQERLWFLDQLDPGTDAYNIPTRLRLRGKLDVEALRRGLQAVVDRHEVLRTRFDAVDGRPVPVVAEALQVSLPVTDLSELPEAEREGRVRKLSTAAARHSFDLAKGPLLATWLLRLGPEEHVFLLTLHHVAGDGWSFGVLVHEVAAVYRALTSGGEPRLEDLPVQYGDFAAWQRRQLDGGELERQLAYWRERLSPPPSPLELPTDRPRPAVQTYQGAHHDVVIDAELAGHLRDLARHAKASLFMVLVTAFKVLLRRLSGQDDVAVGFPIAGRSLPEVEGLIGMFLNTLVLRSDFSDKPTFRELLDRVRRDTLGAFAHQEVPFEKLLAELYPERDLSRTPIFQVFFNMLNLPETHFELPGLTMELLGGEVEVPSKFDLTVYVQEAGDGEIVANLVYNADLFDAGRMVEMAAQYRLLLQAMAADPDASVGAPSLLTPRAAEVLPRPDEPLSAEWRRPLHAGFSRRAAEHPERPAVLDKDESWTYGELDARTSQLARRLLADGLRPGDSVAIFAQRNASLVWALLGILKAGGVFVILDPAYPTPRLLEYARQSRPRALLEVYGAGEPPAELLEFLGDALRTRLSLPSRRDAERALFLADVPVEDPAVELGPDDPAYVAFTSGSTGEPKGILGRHGSLTHFLPWLAETFGFDASDRHSLLSALSHDPLHRDVFMPLWYGATLCVPDPEEIGTPGYLARWVDEERVTILNLTPAMLRILMTGATGARLDSLRYAFLIGDVLTRRDAADLYALSPTVVAVNFYGSTETQRSLAYFPVSRTLASARQVKAVLPLGRGIEDVQILVLAGAGRLAGVGELGEIHFRSHHMALGYLGDERMNRERFLTNPFTGEDGDRLYRTGDLGRFLPDGTVEFAGRADRQVKIRGFRIELQEVEAALARHPSVRECVAALTGDVLEERRLAAWVVAEGERPKVRDLRAFLGDQLPDYMVPTAFAFLDKLPLGPTGKLDRSALPAPELEAVAEEGFAVPRSAEEEVVAAIWSDVLGRENVGIHNDFFELGGHSLLATQVLARLRDAFAVEVPVRRLFEGPTVAALARAVREERGTGASLPPLVRAPRDGDLPLSSSQERLWFLARLEPESPAYNVYSALRLRGRLDEDAFRRSFEEIVRRHEVLRTTFPLVDREPVQRIATSMRLPLVTRDAERDGGWQELLADGVRTLFDLAEGPLFRLLLVRLGEEEHVALLVMHHIVSDAWSMGVLVHELTALYGAFCEGSEPVLEDLPVQYADYALWQRQWLTGPVLESQLAWWKRHLAGAPAALDLPTDRPRPTLPSGRGALYFFELDLLSELKTLGRKQSATLFMTLLTGFQALLGRYSGQRDLSVGTPVANRRQVELEALIGFFVNTLVLRTDLSGGPSFREALARVREGALGAYAHQDLPFERLVEELQPRRDLSRTPLFQVMFVLQNAPTAAVELPGLVLEPLAAQRGTARFDLLLTLTETAEGLAGSLEYSSDLYDETTVTRLVTHLGTLLSAAARAPETRLGELPLLSAAEERQLAEWNATAVAYEPWPSLHSLLEAQAERTPDAVALRFEGESLSYRELNERANRLAHHLRRLGVGADTLVGVAAERSFELVVALIGILKSGGAYVPMDPGYPRDRLAFMLEDAAVPVLLTQERLVAALPEPPAGTRIVCLDAEAMAAESAVNLEWQGTLESLAYMIFTSGSTGRPKGAMVAHGAIVNRLQWMQEAYGLNVSDRVLQKTPFSFDVSVWEFFWPLMTGARLVVARPGGHQDPAYMTGLIVDEEVTTMHFVPSMLQIFVEHPGVEACKSLRRVIVSGEALPYDLEQRFFTRLGGSELHNLYGPTEAAVDVTYQPCSVSEERQAVAIGRPIANLRIHILDRRLRPVPVGVAGELLIAGAGLGRGYLKRPGLTAEKFVPDPLASEPGGRAYKTGDLTRYLPGGEIDYLGRLDHQVKIRGFRIELGEIEACLLDQPEIRETVVMAREDVPGDVRLVAYVVPHGAVGEVSPERLRSALGEALPEYMVPSFLVALESLPLNPSGKADRGALARQALPAPGGERRRAHPPRDAMELELVRIWEEVLGTSPVGVRDDFFELGGHSLSAVRVLARIEEKTGRSLALQAFFRGATVESLARQLRGEAGPTSCLLELQRGTAAEKPPVICVHPAGGNVLAYLPLARALGREQTVYALQSVGLDDDSTPLETVADMASHYVGEVLAAAPRGPFVLLGWSFGGLVAYEMARQLRSAGHEVARVFLLDTAVPRPAGEEDLPYDDDAYWLADVAVFLSAMEGREPPVSHEELEGQPPAEQMRRFLAALQELDYLPPGVGEVQVRRLLRVYKANVRASRGYEPPSGEERLVLLRAAEGDVHAASYAEDPTLGWGEVVPRTLEVRTAPGEHLTLLSRDHVGALAEILHPLLEGNP